ncbi:hypothetical protein [Chitinophaga eiseniae]|uniref:Glycosyl hydrolases related to GH101 family, GHL1-GHL3 n=1 Tax=Chitinophaga eiseniae TaxID=634771 RepID=A0A847SPN8_9BACT|nr:hypothetical protein [Chitinophaga eiseniae]NLR78002.1 hypothetical protein [Chitinophaga eiseniae]
MRYKIKKWSFLGQCAFILLVVIYSPGAIGQNLKFSTRYCSITVNNKGFITSIKRNQTKQEYCPSNMSSALMALEKEGNYLLPVSARANGEKIILSYANGSVATLKTESKGDYLRFELVSLKPRNNIDNVVWGPYKTNIYQYIGDEIGVVHNQDFAFGVFSLDDNTTGGLPCDGDLSQGYYYVHSSDSVKHPLPSHLKEGQRFRFGGDGISDVDMSSQPEEYFKINGGIAAQLEPAFGSSVTMHARDRRKRHLDFITLLPGYDKMNLPRHQWVDSIDADLMGSSIAMFGCPDSVTLQLIEKVVINEKLPHVKTNGGKWIRDPSTFKTDIAWSGVHDSLISYARQLGIQSVQDEGLGEYYPNPANRWGNKKVDFKHSNMSIADYTKQTNKHDIAYGLHTLCEFLQPHNSDVSPVPSDSLVVLYATFISKNISATDTIIYVSDTTFLNEYGGWEGNHTNVLKVGKELIEYNGVTDVSPYTLKHVKRGYYNTIAASHSAGDRVDKLQPNCYRGFAPNIYLQDKYAEYYAQWLIDGGMTYVDFDGLESCAYQAQGTYSYKRFFRKLFDTYHSLGGGYLRVMGSGISEGSWLYMSTNNVGGNNNMYNPITDAWGIEGKDIRNLSLSNYLPCTFGIQDFQANWTFRQADILQSRAIGWNAMYMLGLSESAVESCKDKIQFFQTFRAWENARKANVFSHTLKKEMREESNHFHLEQIDANTWKLYRVDVSGKWSTPKILTASNAL